MSEFERFQIVGKKEKVDHCYGLDRYLVTRDDIEALLAGKRLYSTVNYDEYAILLELEQTE